MSFFCFLCTNKSLLSHLRLDRTGEAYVPRKPLLLLYKLKALRDRRHDLRRKGPILSLEKRSWLRDKWIKDGADLIALMDPQPYYCMITETLDTDLLTWIVEKHCLQFTLESLTELPNMDEALSLYRNADREQVTEWIKNALKQK